MTLDNLQLALKLNNEILLAKIKNLNDTISSITGTDLTNIKQDIKDLNDLLEKAKEDIDSLNTTTITEINQRLDDIDTTLEYIQNTSVPDLDKRIKDNLDDIKKLAKSLTDLTSALDSHIKDTVIHVTQDDKDLWNSTLKNAKDYAKKLFDSVTSFSIQIVDSLPADNIKEMTIYFIRNGRNNETDYYEEYMYINNKWEIIGSTFVNLAPYLLKTDFETYQQEIADKFLKYKTSDELNTIFKDYLKKDESHNHKNKSILDLLTDLSGTLLYNGTPIVKISEETNNAIENKNGLYVPKAATLDSANEQIAELKKQNELLKQEKQSLDSIIDSINRVVI